MARPERRLKLLSHISSLACRYADYVPQHDQTDAWGADTMVVDVDQTIFACLRAYWEQEDANLVRRCLLRRFIPLSLTARVIGGTGRNRRDVQSV